MAKTYLEIAEGCEKEAREHLAKVNEALRKGDLIAYDKGMSELKTAVSTLNQSVCNVEYDKFMHEENPIIAAVKQFHIDLFKVVEERNKETDELVGVRLENKQSDVDLEKLCDFGRLDKSWAVDSEKLLELLTLRETDVYAMKPSDLAKRSSYFIGVASRKKSGETPDSNTQVVALLQKIIDEAIFVDNGEGKNLYKCNNHDIAFIHDSATKMYTKEKCTIAMVNQRQFKHIMMNVFAHCLGEAYRVTSSQKKSK